MDATKLSIGAVAAIILQTSGIVWWTAQQASTLELLKIEVAEITDKVTVEKQINLERDVRELQENLEKINGRLDNHWDEIQASATLDQLAELRDLVNQLSNTGSIDGR